MSFLDSLINGVAGAATMLVKAQRAVSAGVSAGLAAVARVGQQVVRTVEAGWNYVRQGVERAGAAIKKAARWAAQPLVRAATEARRAVDEVREKVSENLGEAQPRRERAGHNQAAARAAREAEQELVVEHEKERIAREEREAMRRAEAVAEAEAQQQYELDDGLRVQFIDFAKSLAHELDALLQRSAIEDFGTYLRIRTCVSLILAFAGDAAEVESFRRRIDGRVVECFYSIKHLADGRELSAAEWAALDELSAERLGGGLIERSGEQLFVMWSGERFDVERRLDAIAREHADAKVQIYDVQNHRNNIVDLELSGDMSMKLDLKENASRVRLERLEAEQAVLRGRLDELTCISGVAEGLLQVLTGGETDDFAIEEMHEASRILAVWATGNSITKTERELLNTLAAIYRVRASQRAKRLSSASHVTLTT